jgi:hypothetical protein
MDLVRRRLQGIANRNGAEHGESGHDERPVPPVTPRSPSLTLHGTAIEEPVDGRGRLRFGSPERRECVA